MADPSVPASREEREAMLRGVRVLVVDDVPDNCEVVAMLLAQFGACVRVACSATAALEAIEGQAFDIVISDLSMPDHDGYWLVRMLREREAGSGGGRRASIATGRRPHGPLVFRRSRGDGGGRVSGTPAQARRRERTRGNDRGAYRGACALRRAPSL